MPSTRARFDQLRKLATEGATSWKFFMAYHGMMVDDPTLIAGLSGGL